MHALSRQHRPGLHDWADPTQEPPQDTDPGLNPPEAGKVYDDSKWEDVQLPHDGTKASHVAVYTCFADNPLCACTFALPVRVQLQCQAFVWCAARVHNAYSWPHIVYCDFV